MKSLSIPIVFVVLFMSSVKFKFLDAVCDGTSCPSAVGSCVADTCWCLNQKGGANCGQSCTEDCAASDKACETSNTCAACDPVCVNGACTAFGYPGTGITCKCVAGWTGDACDEDIDDCDPNPCLNGGTCTDKVNDYSCVCADGYTGTDCADVDCTKDPCAETGTCDDNDSPHVCDCDEGYTGLLCDQVDCTNDPCAETGTCDDSGTPNVCNCDEGYTGLLCDVKDPCIPNPCLNEGNCTISGEGYSCDCDTGYTGVNCESGASRITKALPLMLAALLISKAID